LKLTIPRAKFPFNVPQNKHLMPSWWTRARPATGGANQTTSKPEDIIYQDEHEMNNTTMVVPPNNDADTNINTPTPTTNSDNTPTPTTNADNVIDGAVGVLLLVSAVVCTALLAATTRRLRRCSRAATSTPQDLEEKAGLVEKRPSL
jgi:hypothetical protein